MFMRREPSDATLHRRRVVRVAFCLALATQSAACAIGAQLTRPEGDGGWTPTQRARALAERAQAAGVVYRRGDEPAGSSDTSSGHPGQPLTLTDALALASTGNRRIAESDQQVDRAREQVWSARGRLLPSTTASGRYTWYTDPLTNEVVLPGGVPGGGPNPVVDIREDKAGTIGGLVTVPIDLFGELRHALAGAQAGYRGERARRWATVLAEQAAVVRAYLDMLEAQRLREVTEQTITAQRRQLASAEARYARGRTTKNDLLVVQVSLRNAEQRLVQEELLLARARWALNQAVGLPVNAPTGVVDVVEAPAVPPVDAALDATWKRNPLVAWLVEEQQRLDETLTALERSRLPRFAGGTAIDWTSSDVVQPQDVGSAFVGFTWDLGTDWRRESDIAAARAAAEQNRIATEREMRSLEAAVRFTALAVHERLLAFATAKEAVEQAAENLRIREQQFDAGRAASDDVLTAVTILARERATAATALYQAHNRAAELRQLMGVPIGPVAAREP